MHRIQIRIDEDLNDAAADEAARRGISKVALIREFVARQMDLLRAVDNPWEELIGDLDDGPVEDIDSVIYGR